MILNAEEIPNCIYEAADLLANKDDGSFSNHVFINMDKVFAYINWSETIKKQLKFEMNEYLMNLTGEFFHVNPDSPKQMIDVFVNTLGVPYEQLADTDGTISASQKVINNLSGQYKNAFTRMYLDYKKESAITTNLKPFTKFDDPNSRLINNEGDRIVAMPVFYDFSNTFRFQANHPPMQNIAREETDIITAPKNWVVANIDSKQIEPKMYYTHVVKDPMMDWLIEEYQDVYYAVADYCLREDVSFRPDNLFKHGSLSEDDRNAFKTMTNAGAYGAGKRRITSLARNIVFEGAQRKDSEGYRKIKKISKYRKSLQNPNLPDRIRNQYQKDLNEAEQMLVKLNEDVNRLYEGFTERVINHPQRVEFLRKEKIRVNEGAREFYSPFGDRCVASGAMYYLMNCAINNPLQMGVARLSSLSVKTAYEYIEENDIKELLFYCLNKHDEDVYVVHSSLAEIVLPDLQSFREYMIDDWHPIYSEANLGINYSK